MSDYLTGDGFLQVLALVALAVFWASALTTLGDVYQQVRMLLSRRRDWGTVRRMSVARGDGPDGALAAHRFEQIGHALDARRSTVELTERAHASRVFGGELTNGSNTLSIGEDTPLSVWFGDDAFRRIADVSDSEFTDLHDAAKNEKGVVRERALLIRQGDEVFVAGQEPALVSTFDPGRWTSRKLALLGLFAAIHTTVSVILTVLCFAGPFDGLLVKLAAAGCLAHFLLAPPVLRTVREVVQPPDEARRHWLFTERTA